MSSRDKMTLSVFIVYSNSHNDVPEWLSGTEPLPHTPGAVRPSSLCL